MKSAIKTPEPTTDVAVPQKSLLQKLTHRASTLMHQKDGPLTQDLRRVRGKFELGQVPSRLAPEAVTRTVCGYCSIGCGLDVHVKDRKPVNLSPAANYPVNLGVACPKGWESLAPLRASDRAVMPLRRTASGRLESIDWSGALTMFCERMKAIQSAHGPESIAFLSSGQIVTEEMALLGALAKFGMGMVHADSNTRQCMATSAVAYKQAFGFDSPPYTYQDLEESDVIVLVGSNLCIAHPILWGRVLKNPHNPKIIVIDPRRTETAIAATQHLAIKPKSDLALLYGVAKRLIERGHVAAAFVKEHTNGFEEFREHVASYDFERVCEATGLTAEQVGLFVQNIIDGKRVSFWWTMGVNQSYEGVRTAQAIINLALMTGNIGRPGTGANSVTGQCNAMGSRLYSNTSNLLGGHDFTNPDHRTKIAYLLGIDPGKIPNQNSLPYHQIVEGILAGKIRGLWMIGTNGAHSWINQRHFKDVIKRLDFFVVQDMYHTTESAQLADLILPAAGWGEKEGTFINSERRVGRVKKVARPPGEAITDFEIFHLIAQYWGCANMFKDWRTPQDVFQTLKRVSEGQPCDISGIRDYDMIDELGGIQWPYPKGKEPHGMERRLFEDGRFFHPDGKARFLFDAPGRMPDALNDEYPFVLMTGRGSCAQWHTGTRTSKSAVLRKLYSTHNYVEINPQDARRLGIRNNQWVHVQSRRGKIRARARPSHVVQAGTVFVAMHDATTNQLTDSSFDPHSHQPSYKACAVNVQVIDPSDPRASP